MTNGYLAFARKNTVKLFSINFHYAKMNVACSTSMSIRSISSYYKGIFKNENISWTSTHFGLIRMGAAAFWASFGATICLFAQRHLATLVKRITWVNATVPS